MNNTSYERLTSEGTPEEAAKLPFYVRRLFDSKNLTVKGLLENLDDSVPAEDRLALKMVAQFLDDISSHLLTSPTFAAMAQKMPDIGQVAMLIKDKDRYDEGSKYNNSVIFLSRDEGTHARQFVGAAANLFRRAYHDSLGMNGETFTRLPFDDLIELTRHAEADAQAFEITVAWELKERRVVQPWEKLSRENLIGDHMRAFVRAIEEDASAVENGLAQQAVYEAVYCNHPYQMLSRFDYDLQYKRETNKAGNQTSSDFNSTSVIGGIIEQLKSIPRLNAVGHLVERKNCDVTQFGTLYLQKSQQVKTPNEERYI